jgi:hypothetical protein
MDRQNLLYAAYAGGAVVAAIGIGLWMRASKKTPEDRERMRRERINSFGRITDGTVLDAQEMEVDNKPAQLVIYQYDVGGVSYEASQDITQLRQWVDMHSCRIGLPTSVKYDPQNPGNSIVISEGWIGLRM